jgi:hypothetical protein
MHRFASSFSIATLAFGALDHFVNARIQTVTMLGNGHAEAFAQRLEEADGVVLTRRAGLRGRSAR